MELFRKILLAVVVLEIPIQVDKYFGHNETEALYGAISGYNISLTTICLPLLFAMWLHIQRHTTFRVSGAWNVEPDPKFPTRS